MLASYCDWTEYSLYLLAAEAAGLVERHHLWADDPTAPVHLHANPAISIWDAAAASRANVEKLFTADDPGVFAVVQSSMDLAVGEVTSVAREHFPCGAFRASRCPRPAAARGCRSESGPRRASRRSASTAPAGHCAAHPGLALRQSAGGAAVKSVDVDGVPVAN